jgi:NTP pyrophosphatase (non-canonical NTP hydrolase)
MTDELFVAFMKAEVARARAKFPDQDVWITLAALTEEVGELNQAILHLHFEPGRALGVDAIRAEAVQVAVMAMRVAMDCGIK